MDSEEEANDRSSAAVSPESEKTGASKMMHPRRMDLYLTRYLNSRR